MIFNKNSIKSNEEFMELIPKARSLPYIREEKDGYYSVLSNDGDMNYTMINKTGKIIYDLCDGNNTVNKILDKLTILFPSIEKNILSDDLSKTLSVLTKINAICWRKNNMSTNPFVFSASGIISDQILISLATEDDISTIYEFFVDFFQNQKKYNSKNERWSYVWGTDFREYLSPTVIRQCLYSYYKDFFLIWRQATLVGVIVVKPSYEPFLNDAMIQFVYLEKEIVYNAVKEIIDYYRKFPYKKIKLLKVLLPFSNSGDLEKNASNGVISTLDKLGFVRAGIQRKVYQNDMDIHEYYYEID